MLHRKYQQTLDLLLVFGLMFLSNASAFIHVAWLTPEIVFIELVVWLILSMVSVWILSMKDLTQKLFENLKRNWIMLPFVIFSGLSIFWSVYWEISLFRWLILICTLITGAYIGLRYSMPEIIRLLSVFGAYILFLSSILVFFAPDIGVMNYYSIQGAWKGLYWHKGHMGLIAAFINILFLINIVNSLQAGEKNILFWGLLYIFSLLFVYQTDSVAAYLATIFLHGLILLGVILLRFGKNIRRSHYLTFFMVLIITALILYINIDQFLSIFNRNTSLTGRIPMWTHLFDTYLSKRPLLGYGFNAFWYIDSFRVEIGQAAHYPGPIVIADNGFIDILINTGYVGLILFLIFYSALCWRSIKYAARAKDIQGIFPLILVTYTLIANITWSLIFESEGFFMLMMISVLFCVTNTAEIRSADGRPASGYLTKLSPKEPWQRNDNN